MQAVVSLLPEPYNIRVQLIWDELEERFNLKYIRSTPFPHFTWQLGEGYQQEEVMEWLHDQTLRLQPFDLYTVGLNRFGNSSPVLFIEISKTAELLQLHSIIWNKLLALTTDPSPLYSVESWQPHITLAMEDLSWDRVGAVAGFLQEKDLSWRFSLDNFVIACQQADGMSQIEHIFRFGKGLTDSFDCGLPRATDQN